MSDRPSFKKEKKEKGWLRWRSAIRSTIIPVLGFGLMFASLWHLQYTAKYGKNENLIKDINYATRLEAHEALKERMQNEIASAKPGQKK